MAKIWEKHQGLWRWYNNEVFIPFKKTSKYSITDANLKAGKVYIKQPAPGSGKSKELIQKEYSKRGMMSHEQQWFEQNHWAYDDKTGDVYRIKMENGVQVEKKLCANVPIGTTPQQVGLRIEDRDISVRDEYNTQDRHRVFKDNKMYQTKWCREFNGKNILALVIAKPKMTFAEIKNVIVNEGGSVDSEGVIHRD